jgi:hypothetical protein
VREEWRVVDRWWTEQPVDRRYFDVVLASGENAVVFLDGEAQSWFSQRAQGIACDAVRRTSWLCQGVRLNRVGKAGSVGAASAPSARS